MSKKEAYIVVHVRQGYISDFLFATHKNQSATRMEPGNIKFDIYQSKQDGTLFVLHEVFKSQMDADDHKNTSHYKLWKKTVEPYMASPRKHFKTLAELFIENSSIKLV